MNSVGPKPTLDAVQAEQSVAPTPAPSPVQPPMALLAELTHRCPMRCAYCSNPLALDPVAGELDTEAWKSVLDQAAKMGVLQANFSGGEPALRPDLEQLVAHARSVGLYVNLITSGLPLTQERVTALAEAGLDHVQLALQDITDDGIAAIAKVPAALSHKQAVASWVQETGMALTLNLVITRLNATRVGEMMDMAAAMGAGRCEVANVQYYGWGLRNRAALLPDRDTLEGMISVVEARRAQYQGQMVVDFVLPDYHAGRPKSCMSGWGQRFLNVTPTGKVLPCHAAETVPDLGVETVLERPLAEIWRDGPAFTLFRGEAALPTGCKSCDRRTLDWGGCRCQALALTGSAENMDPVCKQSPHHDAMRSLVAQETQAIAPSARPALHYRGAPPKA